jgi:glycosyltransferase involved in cell wall biosynthesis
MRQVSAKAEPLISVVMPVYNAAAYLRDAVRSIQAQTYGRWELILVDDGSTDGSPELVAELAGGDRRIRALEVDHGGAAHAVNAGVELAGGEMIARMDADDIAVPERFAVQLQWMRRTGVEVCGSCVARFGDATGVIWFPETHDAIGREMLFRHGLLQPTVLMRADAFTTHAYREGAAFEGNDLWIRLRRGFQLGNVPAVLLKHRYHAQQTRVLRGAAMHDFLRAARRPLFHELFPEATRQDADAVDRVAERESCSSLAELERAGRWLARLADSPDIQLRRRMLERWREACRRSAPLGLGASRLYQLLAPELGVGPVGTDASLRAVCAARLEVDGRIARGVRRARRSARHVRQAAA